MGPAALIGRSHARLAATIAAGAAFLCLAGPAVAAAPNTRITAGPSGLTTRAVTFRFKATVPGATFRCRLDARRWSACRSPRSYSGLAAGLHTFRVRAVKNGAADRTPATRKFTVDPYLPDTTIQSGPAVSGLYLTTEDREPVFTFVSNEPGTFQCKLTTTGFVPCSSPFTVAAPLAEADYVFRVRAKDAAGNLDPTPAGYPFRVNTRLKIDLATAQEAAALYLPDTLDLDVAPDCASATTVDCPGGTPTPAGAQLRISSSRSVVPVVGANRFDVTVTQAVTTLAPVNVRPAGFGNCTIAYTSANGMSPTFTLTYSLQFTTNPTTGELELAPANLNVSGMEGTDFTIGGDFVCTIGAVFTTGFASDLYMNWMAVHMDDVAWRFCAAPGPAYLGPCPPPGP